jgi:hypothetical protein
MKISSVVSPFSPSLRRSAPIAGSGSAGPADEVTLSGAAASASAPRGSLLARVSRAVTLGAALACAGIGLAGCGSSLSPEQLGPPVAAVTQEQDAHQAMRFEIVPNQVRVDVIRQTHEEEHCTDDHGHRDCTTDTVDDPYQPVGVYLGRGLFLDAGLNLSVVPDRLYHGPLVPQDFHKATIDGPLGSWTRAHVTQEGNRVGVSQSLNFFDNSFTRDTPDQTTIHLGTFKSLQRFNDIAIKRSGEGIDIQAWAPNVKLLKDMQRVEIRVSGNTVTVHPFGPKTFVDTKITYDGAKVSVQPFGGHFSRTDITRGPGEEIHVDHFGVGKMSTERGQTGMNETMSAFGIHARANTVIAGDHFDIHEPGPFGHTTITVER